MCRDLKKPGFQVHAAVWTLEAGAGSWLDVERQSVSRIAVAKYMEASTAKVMGLFSSNLCYFGPGYAHLVMSYGK
jgi:hypothetical protein